MKEWVYNGMATGITNDREMARIIMDDIENVEASDVFWEWFRDFENIYPDTTVLAFITERADGVTRVSDLLDELHEMFVDWLAENPEQMEYCGASWRDLDAEREDWEADNRD